jgi:ferrous iron transport protein B
MIDELKARGGDVDLFKLQHTLGIPVVGVVGTRGIGMDDLRELLCKPDTWPRSELDPPKDIADRFAWADRLLSTATRKRPVEHTLTRRLDRVLLHPLIGPLVFLTFLVFFFQAIFSWAGPAMDFLAGLMDGLADVVLANAPENAFTSLIADGIIRGVGGVLVFLPQILLLFAVILFLEACGYMARAAFVIDRVMGWIGLEGRCFIALLSSYACAVPGILATRTIPNPKDRLATILVAPLTTCSARLPVYLLLITAFVPAEPLLGPFDWRAGALFGLYLLGALSTMICAAIFKRGMLRGANLPFYLELPPYRMPSLRSIGLGVWERARVFLRRAGTVILAASVILWVLLNFPSHEASEGMSEAQAERARLEQSYAASLGKSLEPVFEPMGFDWRVNVGLVGSFAAREVMNSTLAQIYSYGGDEEDYDGLASVITARDPVTGKPPLERASAFALLVFFVFGLQCISTIAAIRRETNSWRWPLFALAYMTVLAWVGAWLTYQIAS